MTTCVTIKIISCYIQSYCKLTLELSIFHYVSWWNDLVNCSIWCECFFSPHYRSKKRCKRLHTLTLSTCFSGDMLLLLLNSFTDVRSHLMLWILTRTVIIGQNCRISVFSTFSVPLRWVIGAWAQCSVTCGKGLQKREVGCVYQLQNGTYIPTRDLYCLGSKPAGVQHCEGRHCLTVWEASEWSKVWAQVSRNYLKIPHHGQQDFALAIVKYIWSIV